MLIALGGSLLLVVATAGPVLLHADGRHLLDEVRQAPPVPRQQQRLEHAPHPSECEALWQRVSGPESSPDFGFRGWGPPWQGLTTERGELTSPEVREHLAHYLREKPQRVAAARELTAHDRCLLPGMPTPVVGVALVALDVAMWSSGRDPAAVIDLLERLARLTIVKQTRHPGGARSIPPEWWVRHLRFGRSACWAIANGGLNDAQLRRLAAAIRPVSTRSFLATELRLIHRRLLDSLAADGVIPWPPWTHARTLEGFFAGPSEWRRAAMMLKQARELRALALGPLADTVAATMRVMRAAHLEQDPLCRPKPLCDWIGVYEIGAAVRSVALSVAIRRTLRAAVAVERHRLRHGALPPSLDSIDADLLAEVPRDPTDGKPLRYRRTAAGFRVWSALGSIFPHEPDPEQREAVDDGGRTHGESAAALTATLRELPLGLPTEGSESVVLADSWGVSSDTVCVAERWDAMVPAGGEQPPSGARE